MPSMDLNNVEVGSPMHPTMAQKFTQSTSWGVWSFNTGTQIFGAYIMQTKSGFSKPLLETIFSYLFPSVPFEAIPAGINRLITFQYNGQTYTMLIAGNMDIASQIANVLAGQGWAVTYVSTVSSAVVHNAYTNDPVATTEKVIQLRCEKDGIVDEIRFIHFTEALKTTVLTDMVCVMEDPPLTDPEVVLAVARGYLLTEGMKRFEIADQVRPIQSAGTLPAASHLCNQALLLFLRDQTPDEYYTIIEVWSESTGRKAFSLLYNKAFDTVIIYFPRGTNINYAIYNGAALRQLRIRSISLVSKSSSLPASDPSAWTSIQVGAASAETIASTIKLVTMRDKVSDYRRLRLTRAMRELVQETMVEFEEARREKQSRRKKIVSAASTSAEGSSIRQELLPNLGDKPRQLQVGKGDAELRSVAFGMVTGGMGGMAGIAKGVGGMKGSLTSGRIASKNGIAKVPVTSSKPMAAHTDLSGGR